MTGTGRCVRCHTPLTSASQSWWWCSEMCMKRWTEIHNATRWSR